MTTFKKGDRVKVVKTVLNGTSYKLGDTGTVVSGETECSRAIYVDIDNGTKGAILWADELEPAPAPALITIDRNDLPEVVEDGDGYMVGDLWRSGLRNAKTSRASALDLLALAEFLEARERRAAEDAEAEKVGEQVMRERRDALAVELASTDKWVCPDGARYEYMSTITKAAIDRIITLEDAAKC